MGLNLLFKSPLMLASIKIYGYKFRILSELFNSELCL